MRRRELNQNNSQAGAALITALLTVALISVAALTILENITVSAQLTRNLYVREQARLYALGAEELAVASMREALNLSKRAGGGGNSFPALDEWTRQPISFPIEGGFIRGRVKDGANCFNLNALVAPGDQGALVANPQNIDRFAFLLEEMQVNPGEAAALANSVADWMDTDDRPLSGGAEDPEYAIQDPPYRTSKTWLHSVSELQLISGFNPEIVSAIRQWVCVRPSFELSPLNVNTLRVEDAPILTAYLGREYNMDTVIGYLEDPSFSGFADILDFFEHNNLQSNPVPEENRGLFALKSDYYDLSAEINYHNAAISIRSTLQIHEGGDITTLSRSYGAF